MTLSWSVSLTLSVCHKLNCLSDCYSDVSVGTLTGVVVVFVSWPLLCGSLCRRMHLM